MAGLPPDCHYQYAITTIARKYNMPGVFYLDLWPAGVGHVVVIDPDAALQMTVTLNHPKHEAEKWFVDPLMGVDNIVTTEGPRWKHSLHSTNNPYIAEELMEFRCILRDFAQAGDKFMLEELTLRTTFDVIGKATFGHSLNAKSQGSEALLHWEAMSSAFAPTPQSWNLIKNFFANRIVKAEAKKLDAIPERNDAEELSQLDYTTNVVKEVLRFYPIGNTARAHDPTQKFLSYQGQHFPTEGKMLCSVQRTMYINEDMFPNANKFDPDRYTREDFPRHAWRPFERAPVDRAKSLVALYTLEEKINATTSASRGVSRLGIPPYDWWNEGLHGIAGHNINFTKDGEYSHSTSFPQPILMGAAFDDELITKVGTVIATEARAFSNANRGGLDFWTPNINPFRDPRWGRGQETPGEDPYHLSSYVAALVKGLQGDDSDPYRRVIATCKHFAGYDIESWNGNLRYQFDAHISQQDLVEYYLPSFESCVRSNVGAFMCSYNSVNGVPSCANEYLLQTILRDHWGFSQDQAWVTSDCDAIQNVYLPLQWSASRAGAAADSLNAGTDVDCGTYMQAHLPAAFAQGLTNETVLDQALVRQYASLVRLGWFDAAEGQPYRQIGWEAVATNASQQLARQAASEGIVLLKNNGVLPMRIDSSTRIGLFGDWANATWQLLGSYAGVSTYLHSPLYALQQLNATINYAGGLPGGQGDPTTGKWIQLQPAMDSSDVLIYIGGIDNGIESEGIDRESLQWTGAQLDVIGQLADTGKPTIVVCMGGGQMDSAPIANNANISALLWAGYPGQDGGPAIVDILTGKVAPAGRLSQTQYPSHYISQVAMTDMALRPSDKNPGRTYKWYNGTATFDFGFGMHYTNFSASITSGLQTSYSISDLTSNCNKARFKDQCPFASVQVAVQNTGKVTSDYVVLGYIAGNHGPAPHPKKSLVRYQRLHSIAGGSSGTATLHLTLASLARVDEMGNKVLYPGDYTLLIDNQPLASYHFTLTGGGNGTVLEHWPQPPPVRKHTSSGYFVGGYGSYQAPV
ncbi:hypothetical protein ACEQ8H_008353 [Pleosporales sp. CAS-2024a]